MQRVRRPGYIYAYRNMCGWNIQIKRSISSRSHAATHYNEQTRNILPTNMLFVKAAETFWADANWNSYSSTNIEQLHFFYRRWNVKEDVGYAANLTSTVVVDDKKKKNTLTFSLLGTISWCCPKLRVSFPDQSTEIRAWFRPHSLSKQPSPASKVKSETLVQNGTTLPDTQQLQLL